MPRKQQGVAQRDFAIVLCRLLGKFVTRGFASFMQGSATHPKHTGKPAIKERMPTCFQRNYW